MQSDLITKLNVQIAEISANAIQEHIDKGDLKDWLANWQFEIASTSLSLFLELQHARIKDKNKD